MMRILYIFTLVTVFLFPFYIIRFSVFDVPTTVVEIVIYILFALWLVFIWKNKVNFHLVLGVLSENKLLFTGLFLFVFGAFLAALLSADVKTSFGLFKAYFIDPVLFFAVFVAVFDITNIKKALQVFALSSFFVLFLSVFSLLSGKLSVFFSPITYDLRFQGIFHSPNYFAMFLAPLVLIAFYFIFESKAIFLKIIWIVAFTLSCVALFFTFSYSAFFGVFATIIFASFYYAKGKFKFILPLLMFIFGFILLFSQASSPKMQAILTKDSRSSFTSREMIWSSAIEILKDNYIFGVGPGMFQKHYLDYQERFDKQYLEWAVPYPHNIFLAFWIQNGIIGFAGFLMILFWVWRIWKRSDLSPERSDLPTLAMSFFIYFLIHGMMDTPYWKNDLALIFFFFLAVIVIWRLNLQTLEIESPKSN